MTITTLDFLYLCLAIGFVVLVYFLVTLINRIMKTLDRLDVVLEDVKDTTGGIRDFKNQAKSTFFSTASMLLGLVFGRKKG